jgi:hypothetical protein
MLGWYSSVGMFEYYVLQPVSRLNLEFCEIAAPTSVFWKEKQQSYNSKESKMREEDNVVMRDVYQKQNYTKSAKHIFQCCDKWFACIQTTNLFLKFHVGSLLHISQLWTDPKPNPFTVPQ